MTEAVEVTQADREAAASGYFAWCSGNPVIPDRMKDGNADDHSMVQAFARHRIAHQQDIAAQREDAARQALEAAADWLMHAPPHLPMQEYYAGYVRAIDPARFRGD